MIIKGKFKVLSINKSKDGSKQYVELGDTDTFSKISIDLAMAVEEGKVYDLEIPAVVKSGKFGLYFQSV